MDYIILPLLDNKYPNFRNYTKDANGNVILSGIYANKNKLEFRLPSLDNITMVSGTTFRFILSVSKNADDKNPKFFTSELYYSDLKDSIDEGNPYFSTYSIFTPFIVNVFIKDAIDLFAKLDPLEKDVPVAVIKNVFASGKDKNGNAASTIKVDLGAKKSQLDDLISKLKKIDDSISKNEVILSQSEVGSYLRGNNKKNSAAEITKLKSDRISIADAIKVLEAEINSINGNSKKVETTPGAEPNTFAKPTIPDVTLTEKDVDIDYNELVKYIDWLVAPTIYSTESAETGGVKDADEIGDWAGELIDNYKARIAKKEAAKLESSTSNQTNKPVSNSATPTPAVSNMGGNNTNTNSNTSKNPTKKLLEK
jgi:hypothetical protein